MARGAEQPERLRPKRLRRAAMSLSADYVRKTVASLTKRACAVVAAKGKDDADFLATIVEAQAARAAASKAVLDKLQPTLGPRPSLLSPAVCII